MSPDEELAFLRRLSELQGTDNRAQMTHGKSTALDIENPVITFAKAVPRGVVKAGEFMAQSLVDIPQRERDLIGMIAGRAPKQEAPLVQIPHIGEGLIPTADNAHPFFNTAGEGFGGGAAFAPSSALRAGIVGALSTGGGAAGEALGGQPGAVAGSLLTGMAGGAAVGPRQSQAQSAMKRATEGMAPEDWQIASENLGKYASSKATTGTLPEMFPGNTRLLTLALEARNSRGGEKLSSQVAGRNQDLAGLTNRAIEVSGVPGVPADVANEARAVANTVVKRAQKQRSAQYTRDLKGDGDITPTPANFKKFGVQPTSEADALNRFSNGERVYKFSEMDGQPVLVKSVDEIRSGAYGLDQMSVLPAPKAFDATAIAPLREIFIANAKAAQSKVEKDAYLAAADALTQANPGTKSQTNVVPMEPVGKKGFRTAATSETVDVPTSIPKTELEAIVKDLKQMQDRVNNLNLTGGEILDKGAVRQRYSDVQEVLKALSPQYRTAETNYANTSKNVVDPLVSGPIGDISGRNPNSRVDPSASLLSNITKDQTPESIPGIMSTLQSGTELPSQLLPQIARALVAQKLQKGPLNASQAVRGTPGSPEEANVRALLTGANVNPKPLMDTLDTSAMLQTPQFRSAPSSTGEVPQATMGMRIPSFTRIAAGLSDKFLGTAVQNRYYRQISDLLADPSPAALKKLQEIAMFDPNVRREMALRATVGATAATQGD